MPTFETLAFGAEALLARWPDGPGAAALARDLARAMRARGFGAVPGAASVLVVYSRGQALATLRARSEGVPAPALAHAHEIPVIYDGPDLAAVAADAGITPDELVAAHAATTYTVAFLGFMPGFPYLEANPPGLQPARLATPRAEVPAGAIGLVGRWCGVYPRPGPGGWPLIGRAGVRLFDPLAAAPALLEPGDRVRFVPVEVLPPTQSPPAGYPPPARPRWRVLRAGVATVQDGGRPGWGHVGLAEGGALDPAGLGRANRRVGNPLDMAGIEALGPGLVLEALWPSAFAVDDPEGWSLDGRPLPATGRAWARRGSRLARGQGGGWAGYLAWPGGADVPVVMGSRATHLASGFGGLEGRPLRNGDMLGRLTATTHPHSTPPAPSVSGGVVSRWCPAIREVDGSMVIRLLLEPRLSGLSLAELAPLWRRPFTIAAASRVGLRLAGPRARVEGLARQPSHGVPFGAVQLSLDGDPLILLAERGATGGYPAIGAIHPADRAALVALGPGSRLWLRPILAPALAPNQG